MNKLLKLFIAGAVFFPIISTAADKYQKEISNDLVTKFSNAREQRRSGDLNKSIAALRAIVATRSDYYLANYNLALALTDAKKYAEAEKYYLLSIEIAKQKKSSIIQFITHLAGCS